MCALSLNFCVRARPRCFARAMESDLAVDSDEDDREIVDINVAGPSTAKKPGRKSPRHHRASSPVGAVAPGAGPRWCVRSDRVAAHDRHCATDAYARCRLRARHCRCPRSTAELPRRAPAVGGPASAYRHGASPASRKRKTAARGRPAGSGARMLTPDACEGSGQQLRSRTPPRSSSRGTPPLPAPPALMRMSAASAILGSPANDTALLLERARVLG